ncbi:MAG: phosphoribosyltransferase family protein [Patescibacteria group bacterium]
MAYAGKYPTDSKDKNYVGAEYFNFALAETEPSARSYFAGLIGKNIVGLGLKCDVVVGAPMGGILLAGAVGEFLGCRTIFAEKKVIAVADMSIEGSKEVSEQILNRHEMNPGDNVIVMEDVCNNFSTTQKLKKLIEDRGGKLIGIACAFNRSGKTEWEGIPVVAAHYIPTKQFRQDDPEIVDLMTEGKIVWNPKNDWDKLQKAMEG